jgi:hypothetical protein
MIVKFFILPLVTEGRYAPQGRRNSGYPSGIVLADYRNILLAGFNNRHLPVSPKAPSAA